MLPCRGGPARRRVRLRRDQRNADQDGHRDGYAAGFASTSIAGLLRAIAVLTTDLRLTVGAANGAAGTIFYPLDFTNASSSACTMYGYPGVAFVSSPGGSQVGAPAGRGSVAPTLITLSPGATAHATLAVSDVLIANNCLDDQVQVSWVQVYPPDQYSALSAPLSRQGCADRSLVTMHVSTASSGS